METSRGDAAAATWIFRRGDAAAGETRLIRPGGSSRRDAARPSRRVEPETRRRANPDRRLDAANVYKRRKSSADGEDPDAKGLAVAAVAPSHVTPDPPSRALPPDGAAPVASPPQRDRGL